MMKDKTLWMYVAVSALCLGFILWLDARTGGEENVESSLPDKGRVLTALRKQADVATTTVRIRKIGQYNTESEKVTLNPATWKLGERVCLLPVDITIKYGIDLNDLNDVELEGNIVKIRLPKAKVIESGYEPKINPREIVSFSTGMRSTVGYAVENKVKQQAYQYVMADKKLASRLSDEIEKNTKKMFTSMLKGMGLVPVFVD